jgi:hypothetical protein
MEYLLEKDEEKDSLLKENEFKMYILDFIIMLLGLMGTGLSLYEHELFFTFSEDCIDTGKLQGGQECLSEEPDKNFYIRLVVTLSTGLLCLLIVYRYFLLLRVEKLKDSLDQLDTLYTSGLYIGMIAEVLYCLIHVPPRFNVAIQLNQYEGDFVYTLNMLISLLMLGRVYMIWRIFIHYSKWNSFHSNAVCRSCSCKGGINFAVKAELKERPYTVVAGVMIVSILVFGVALRNLERPFQHKSGKDWDYVWNGMWCIIITMATVGYGDYFATTHLGRFISVIACFWGTFLISLMVLSLTISSEFTPQESKSFNKIKKDEAEQEVKVKAANAIKFGIRLKIFLRKNPNASEKKKSTLINKFKSALIEFRTFSMKLKASEQDAPIELVLSRLNDKVTYVLDKIKNDCYVYKGISSKLEAAENNQKIISNSIEELFRLNEMVILKVKSK